jgi:hypothetical protein
MSQHTPHMGAVLDCDTSCVVDVAFVSAMSSFCQSGLLCTMLWGERADEGAIELSSSFSCRGAGATAPSSILLCSTYRFTILREPK